MTYDITKSAANKSTVINDSDGPKYVINTRVNFYTIGNAVVLEGCFPELTLTAANCKVAGVATANPNDIVTKLLAINAFNPNA